MNIGMMLNAPYPSDMRVLKESRALVMAGHNVFLLCLQRTGEQRVAVHEGVTIHRIKAGESKLALAFWDVILSITFVHPVFRKHTGQWIRKNKIDVLHVHDLPLVGTALAVKRKFSLPVVADFHENYPEALATWFEWKKNPVARIKNAIFMNTKRWKRHELTATIHSDRIIAVVDEMKERLLHEYKHAIGKVTVVSNTEERSFIEQVEDKSVFDLLKSKFIVTYSGNIGPHRGVDTAIEAMKFIESDGIVLAIIGSGSAAVMNHLASKIRQLGVDHKVKMLGRQPFEKFYSFMKFSDINLIPHKSNPHTDNTIPHKLFQAMMVGKPVIVSSSATLKRVITVTNAGVVFEAGNAKDLAEKIITLYNDKELQQRLGANGMKATLDGEWNWEHEQERLIDLYRNIQV